MGGESSDIRPVSRGYRWQHLVWDIYTVLVVVLFLSACGIFQYVGSHGAAERTYQHDLARFNAFRPVSEASSIAPYVGNCTTVKITARNMNALQCAAWPFCECLDLSSPSPSPLVKPTPPSPLDAYWMQTAVALLALVFFCKFAIERPLDQFLLNSVNASPPTPTPTPKKTPLMGNTFVL